MRVVLTLGSQPWCTSTWHSIYYRVWRVDSSGPKRLVDGEEFAWLRTGTYAVGSVARDLVNPNAPVDVLIEFTQRSVDSGVHNREAIRHLSIKGDRAELRAIVRSASTPLR